MKQDEAKRIIQDCLENNYNSNNFNRLVANILTTPYRLLNDVVGEKYVREGFKDSISSYVVHGTYEDPTGKKLAILEVRLRSDSSLQHARTMQRNFVADFLKGDGNINYSRQDGALVAFVGPSGVDWRFSLVKMEYSLEIQEGKIKAHEKLTPAKRWSFLVEKGRNHTAQSRFLPLVMEESHGTTFLELENAFDVESVTDEFFEQYKECFFRFKDEIDRVIALNDRDRAHFEAIGLDTANFTKKTLGQIAFLYFLQKKGWFGVASDKNWGEGPKNFLRELFNRREKYGKNFFNDVLEPLFYDALARDRRDKNDIYESLNNCRIPFLNGGLFEPMKGYEWEKTDLTINDEVFSNDHKTKNGDIGDGIFDVFDRYNFTVSEDEPLEKEVAVDPEMLGKIFENLLEIRDRKSKGAFYTPRPIVHYMCQESLIEYLTNIDISIAREDIEFFIRESEVTLENDKTTKKKIEEKISKGQEYRDDYKYQYKTPASIREKANELDQALANIRIADPAVGSGAFPLGMINEIVRARQILAVHTGGTQKAYDLKLHAIQENIYGVDIEPGAVEICQLRLWLSLIVDETEPHPLPNLNYRIMQGNSLIEEYEGIKLYDTKLLSADKSKKAEQSDIFSLEDSRSNQLYNELQVKLKRFIETSGRTEKEALKKQIDELKFGLIEATLGEQGKEEKISEIRRLREANITPFFLWKLEFSEVFQEKGGFDVVIGNPPYVGEKGNKDIFRPIAESSLGKRFYQGKMDLFYFFFHLGLDLLREKGTNSFITTNYFITSTGGKNLRNDIKNRSTILKLLNFGEFKIFESALGQHNMITSLQKGKSERLAKTFITNRKGYQGQGVLIDILKGVDEETKYYNIQQEKIFSGDNMKLTIGGLDDILDKIKLHSNALNTIATVDSGHRSGASHIVIEGERNGIFILTDDELKGLNLNPQEQDVVKKLFKSSDIDKFILNIKKPLYYLNITFPEYGNSSFQYNYPNIFQHLLKYKDHLLDRGDTSIDRYISQGYWWISRVNRSIKLENPGIAIPYRTKDLSVALSNMGFYALTDVYFVNNPKNNYSLNFLLGMLNSQMIYVWLFNRGKRKGDMLELYQEPLSNIPIPIITPDNLQYVAGVEQLVNKILDIKNENKDANISTLEKEIDSLVYRLYDLTEEEIAIVEGR